MKMKTASHMLKSQLSNWWTLAQLSLRHDSVFLEDSFGTQKLSHVFRLFSLVLLDYLFVDLKPLISYYITNL